MEDVHERSRSGGRGRSRSYSGTVAGLHRPPAYGRFVQPDPIGYEAGMNMYGYVRADPVNRVDPLGLRDICWTVDETTGDGEGGVIVQSRRECIDVPDWAVEQPGEPINWGGTAPPPTNHLSPDGKRACGSVPPAPPGVSIDNIIRYGRDSADLNAINSMAFVYKNFRSGAGMDFKQINANPGLASPFEGFGNFAYGAFTYAIGINRVVALAGAGFAQLRSGNGGSPASYFDDPEDQEQIKKGRQYAACQLR